MIKAGIMEGLAGRLRALARHEHSDFSIGNEAADMIMKLADEVAWLKVDVAELEAEVTMLNGEINELECELSFNNDRSSE
jgi:uncharacterized small protein (DUF1192 family)